MQTALLRTAPVLLAMACAPGETTLGTDRGTDPSTDTAAEPGLGPIDGWQVADFGDDGSDQLVVATPDGMRALGIAVDGDRVLVEERASVRLRPSDWEVGHLLPWGTGLFVMNARGSRMVAYDADLDQQWEGTFGEDLPAGSMLAGRLDTDADDDLTIVSSDATTLLRMRNDGIDGWQVHADFVGDFGGFDWVDAGPLLGGPREDMVVVGPQLLVTSARDDDFAHAPDAVLADAPHLDAVVAQLEVDGPPHLVAATVSGVTAYRGDPTQPALFRVDGMIGLERVRQLVRIPGGDQDTIGVVHAGGFTRLRGPSLDPDGDAPLGPDVEVIHFRDQGASWLLWIDLATGQLGAVPALDPPT